MATDQLATVYHADLWGDREKKYEFLERSSLKSIKWKKLEPSKPDFFMVPKNFNGKEEYDQGFSVLKLFPVNSVGIATARDVLTIHETKDKLIETIKTFSDLTPEEARKEFKLGKDVRDWRVQWAQEDLRKENLDHKNIYPISYRPFDRRWTYFTGRSRGFHCMPRPEVMRHLLSGQNIALLTSRLTKGESFAHALVSRDIAEVIHLSSKTSNNAFVFPLYRYDATFNGVETKNTNLDPSIFSAIKKSVPDVTPETLFNYIYAALHSPAYRQRYAEFLKSDFPRIPYPQDKKTFHALSKLGEKLRELHLMESKTLDKLITKYPMPGDHKVEVIRFGKERVWINETQYFEGVPEAAWNFYIGGYQPAQKWLKDRKGRSLTAEEIKHWQRIIVALTETDKIMKEIDEIDFLPRTKKAA